MGKIENLLLLVIVLGAGAWLWVKFKDGPEGDDGKPVSVGAFVDEKVADARDAAYLSTDPVTIAYESGYIPNSQIDDNETAGGLISAIPQDFLSDPGKWLANNGIF